MAAPRTRNLNARILLQQRGADLNGDPLGDWVTVASSAGDGAWAAELIRLRGGEAVLAQRLEGQQPVILTVGASSATRRVNSAWRAIDTRTRQIYNITSMNEDDTFAWVEILATGKAGDLAA